MTSPFDWSDLHRWKEKKKKGHRFRSILSSPLWLWGLCVFFHRGQVLSPIITFSLLNNGQLYFVINRPLGQISTSHDSVSVVQSNETIDEPWNANRPRYDNRWRLSSFLCFTSKTYMRCYSTRQDFIWKSLLTSYSVPRYVINQLASRSCTEQPWQVDVSIGPINSRGNRLKWRIISIVWSICACLEYIRYCKYKHSVVNVSTEYKKYKKKYSNLQRTEMDSDRCNQIDADASHHMGKEAIFRSQQVPVKYINYVIRRWWLWRPMKAEDLCDCCSSKFAVKYSTHVYRLGYGVAYSYCGNWEKAN